MATLSGLQPWLRPYAEWLLSVAPYAGARRWRVSSVRRSRAKQQALYNAWQSGRHPYPVAPPGRSMHEYGRAFDVVTEPYSALYQLGAWWREVGGTWGGDADPIHFEA